MIRLFLIYSREHNAWWKPGGKGYTTQMDAAGRYVLSAATAIVNDACVRAPKNDPPEFYMLAPEYV